MQIVFIVGAPRSGTTWLQKMLASHPGIVTVQETHFFSGYIGSWTSLWEREATKMGRRVGLSASLTEEEFLSLCRNAAEFLFARLQERKPAATIVLEKTPVHVHHIGMIRALFPCARVIHLVRDPRSVVASLRAAAQGWGKGWANKSIASSALLWRNAVRAGDEAGRRYQCVQSVRYEVLRKDTPTCLTEIFAWLGLPADLATCDRIHVEHALSHERGLIRSDRKLEPGFCAEPEGFVRDGSVSGWKKELRPSEVRLIEYLTRDEMQRHGYELVYSQKRHTPPLQQLPAFVYSLLRGDY